LHHEEADTGDDLKLAASSQLAD